MAFIANWATNKISEYAKVGLQAGGSMAGNAVGGVGSMVENAGRNAGGGVTGKIAGVGNYINGYGESIKSSMSSDGPVSSGQKKTAVKPSGALGKAPAQAQRTAGGAQQKALPAAGGAASKAGGAARSVGSTAQKTASSATGAARTPSRPAAGNNATKKDPSTSTRSAASYPKGAAAGGGSSALKTPANNGNGPAQNTRASQATNRVQNRTTDGKVQVSAASRPGAKVGAAGGGGAKGRQPIKGLDNKKHDAKDPLGMGG